MTGRQNLPTDLSGHELKAYWIDDETIRRARIAAAGHVLRTAGDRPRHAQLDHARELLEMLGLVETGDA